MSLVSEDHPKYTEETAIDAVCAGCGNPMLLMVNVFSTAGDQQHYRRVEGSFIQALDDEGCEVGPLWAFCPPCVASGAKTLPTTWMTKWLQDNR